MRMRKSVECCALETTSLFTQKIVSHLSPLLREKKESKVHFQPLSLCICWLVELMLVSWTHSSLKMLKKKKIDNVIFANIFSRHFLTSLTFRMNTSSYHEYTFDRLCCTPAAALPWAEFICLGILMAPCVAPQAPRPRQLTWEKRSWTRSTRAGQKGG